MNQNNRTRPPLESLACVNAACDLCGQCGQDNLVVRKTYGADKIRYLRCRQCQTEFSERKGTALWNTKIRESKAMAVAEQLSEGSSFKGTARLVKVDPSTVRRLCRVSGRHAQAFHDEKVQDIVVDSLHADERWGFVGRKVNKCGKRK